MQLLRIGFQIITELLAAISYPLWRMIDPVVPTNTDAKQTILIVERWFNTNGLHKLWVKYLTNKGFAVHMVNFPIQDGTFEESAQKLNTYIEQHHLKNFTLVGISGGGLTCYLYLQHHNGWEKVKKFISLGTAFYGTPMAIFISFIKSGRELFPTSNFMQKIKQEAIQHPEKIINLSAQFDELSPQKSTQLPGTRHIRIDVFGHNNFHLDTRQTYDMVARLASE